MCKPWINDMLDSTSHYVHKNEDLSMVRFHIERYGESSYELGRADAIKEFAEWLEKEGYLNTVDVDYDWEEEAFEITENLSAEYVVRKFMEVARENNG